MYHPRSPQRAQVFFMQSLPEPAAGADLKTLNNSLSPPQAPIFFSIASFWDGRSRPPAWARAPQRRELRCGLGALADS